MTDEQGHNAAVNPIESTPLLPCPHCGSISLNGPHFQEYVGDYRDPYWWIECNECPAGMEVNGENICDFTAAWNRRCNDK